MVESDLCDIAGLGQSTLHTAVLRNASLLSSLTLRKRSLIRSNLDIVLGQSPEENSGKKNVAPCSITVLVSSGPYRINNYTLTSNIGTSSIEYLKSIARREVEWIKTYAGSHEATQKPWRYVSPGQDDPGAHISLLKKFISAVSEITPKDPDLVSSRLWHPDFHAGNIYIDSNYRISSIIDWQGAWTTPLFLGAKPPLVLDYSVEMKMFLPDDFKILDDTTKDQLRYQVAHSILIHKYENSTAEKNPLMYRMMRYPYSRTLKQLEAFAGGTWDNCLFPFENCLMTVEGYASDQADYSPMRRC